MCGGIVTNRSGRTTIENLYAIGECACTGLHGANRLASNSLLEAMVFSHAPESSAWSGSSPGETGFFPRCLTVRQKPRYKNSSNSEMVMIAHNWDFIRRLMWNYVGIVRTDKRLALALTHILQIKMELKEHMPNIPLSSDLVELQGLALMAELIIRCAVQRRESRGLHFNVDHPGKGGSDWLKDTVVRKSAC